MSALNAPLRAAIVAALLLLTAAATARASARAPMYFDAGRAAVDDSTREATLERLDSLGVRALRLSLPWAAVAPAATSATKPAFDAADPNAYDWGGYGRLVDAAHARGWRILVTFSAPVPKWATAAHRDQVTRPSALEFGAFATAAGRRLGAAVDAWGMWNEPNHPRFLLPQYVHGKPTAPSLYRALHLAGVRGLEAAGQAKDTMLGGETAPGGDRKRSVPPLQFLRGVLTPAHPPSARLRIDGWAHHPYANRRGPFYVPPDKDNVTVGVMRRLESALTKVGRPATKVWVTEFGVQSTPDTTLGVPLAQQAEYRSISERILRADPRVAAMSQYLLNDDAALSGFQSGLVTAAGRAKPSLDEFRLPLTVRRTGSTALLWGLVRPASMAGATHVEVLVRDKSSAHSTAVTTRPTDGVGVWTARLPWRSGRTWRVRWTAPGGATYVGPPVRVYG
ncbi:hypothetical protein DSM104299_05312 [Baekduia alba]|uniref:hypothetical protein n=1 Tax=Baekduia alba TaxID=2997333 RepID=UPI0023414285|nr:hypothetical protein [Baekduia alba]WCB96551.1 hypothetical protein DSM104299_05312 [Baekduia alba]